MLPPHLTRDIDLNEIVISPQPLDHAPFCIAPGPHQPMTLRPVLLARMPNQIAMMIETIMRLLFLSVVIAQGVLVPLNS